MQELSKQGHCLLRKRERAPNRCLIQIQEEQEQEQLHYLRQLQTEP